MRSQALKILDQKLGVAVRAVDEAVASEVNNVWKRVNRSPECPTVGDVLVKLKKIFRRALEKREECARTVTLETLNGFQKLVDKKFARDAMTIVSNYFPEDQYLSYADSTKGVFERGALPNKYVERLFDLEYALIKVNIANLSRLAVANIKTAVDELTLIGALEKPRWWKTLGQIVVHWFAIPVIRVIVTILSTVVAAGLIYYLGFSNG